MLKKIQLHKSTQIVFSSKYHSSTTQKHSEVKYYSSSNLTVLKYYSVSSTQSHIYHKIWQAVEFKTYSSVIVLNEYSVVNITQLALFI